MPTLIELMKDPSVVVRDTTAWTVGRICEMLPEAAINDIYLAPLLQCLMEGLSAEPRVASNVCWVRQSLCCWAYDKFLSTRGMQLLLVYMNTHTHMYIYTHIRIYTHSLKWISEMTHGWSASVHHGCFL